MVKGKRVLIGVLLLTVVVLLNLPVPLSLRVKAAASEQIVPFQNMLSWLIRRGRAVVEYVTRSARAGAERQALERRIAELQSRLWQLESLARENAALRGQLEVRRRSPHRLIACTVVARSDISGWWQTVRLSRGSEDGIRPDMAVITTAGLVGRTTTVSRHTSDVLLITDPNCRVSCRLGRTGAPGVLKGGGVAMHGPESLEMLCPAQPLQMDYVSKNETVLEQDVLVTSGLGGIFPADLLVGHVVKSFPSASGLYLQAEVVPAADLSNLRQVFVVGDARGPETPHAGEGGSG